MVVQWIVSLSCEAGSAGSNPVHSMSDSFFFVPVKCKLPFKPASETHPWIE